MELGRISLLCMEIVDSIRHQKPSRKELLNQFYFIGVKSQSVVLITGAFTGMVLCAQTYFQFHKVKMDTATLAVVSVSMCGELGPVLTALMIAGRVGASMSAELATMKVTEQIDALRTLATHPIDYLVVPRICATLLAAPLLTAEAIALGIGAAYVLGTMLLGIDPVYSWQNMLKYTHSSDVMIGFIKSIVFGGTIAVVSCHKGMTCADGAEGVGRAATETVVMASIAVLISNFFMTLGLSKLFQWL